VNQVDAVKLAVNRAGSQQALADLLNVAQCTVNHWINRDGRIGAEYALKCALATGVSAYQLRPDLYPRGAVTVKRELRSA